MNTNLYITIDIGCIECGEATNILYVGDDLEASIAAAAQGAEAQQRDWHGQHSFEVFAWDGETAKPVAMQPTQP